MEELGRGKQNGREGVEGNDRVKEWKGRRGGKGHTKETRKVGIIKHTHSTCLKLCRYMCVYIILLYYI